MTAAASFFGEARQPASLPSSRQHDMMMVNAARGTNDSALGRLRRQRRLFSDEA
jgi:hypothetical protein